MIYGSNTAGPTGLNTAFRKPWTLSIIYEVAMRLYGPIELRPMA